MCRYAALANVRLPITDSGRMAVSGQSFMATGGQNPMSADTRIRSAHLGSHQPRQGAIPDERDDWHRSASATTANAPKARTPKKPSARSSANSPTSSTGHSSQTPADSSSDRQAREDNQQRHQIQRDRLNILNGRLLGSVTPGPDNQPYDDTSGSARGTT